MLASIAIHKGAGGCVQAELDRLAAALDNENELNSLLRSLQNRMLPEPEPEPSSVTAPALDDTAPALDDTAPALDDTAPALDNSVGSNMSFTMGGGY